MGNKSGKTMSPNGDHDIMPTYKESLHKFHGKELKDLKKTFKVLCKLSETGDKTVSKKVFEEHFLEEKTSDFHLPPFLAEHIFSAFDWKHADKIDFEEFVIGMSMCCKGTTEEKMEFVFHLMAADNWGDSGSVVTRDTLKRMLDSCVGAVDKLLNIQTNEQEEYVISTLVNEAFDHFAKTASDKLTYEEFKHWAETNSQVMEFFEFLLHKGYQHKYTPSVNPCLPDVPPPLPQIHNEHGTVITSDLISNDDQLGKLRDTMNQKYRHCDFELLYKPAIHGYSLKTLLTRSANKSPVLMLVKDKEGHIFGGFSSQPIHTTGGYYGDENCYVFSLTPEVKSYHPDTVQHGNNNFVTTTNNYIGFGGPDHAVWLDADIDKGVSKECSTYGNPCLSGEPEFQCVQMELYHVKVKLHKHDEHPQLNSALRTSTSNLKNPLNKSTEKMPLSPKEIKEVKDKDKKEKKDKKDKKAKSPSPKEKSPKEKSPKEKSPTSPRSHKSPKEELSKMRSEEDMKRIQELESAKEKLEQELQRMKSELEMARNTPQEKRRVNESPAQKKKLSESGESSGEYVLKD